MSVEIHYDQPLVFGKTTKLARACGYELSCKTCERDDRNRGFAQKHEGVIAIGKIVQEARKQAYVHDLNQHNEQGEVKLVIHVEPPVRHEDIYVK